jgi:hypothetical protein
MGARPAQEWDGDPSRPRTVIWDDAPGTWFAASSPNLVTLPNKYVQGGPGSILVVTAIATLEVACNFVQVIYINSCHGCNSLGMLCLLFVHMTIPSAFAL